MPIIEASGDKIKTRPRLVRKLRLVMWLGLIGGPIVFAIGLFQYLEAQRVSSEGISTAGAVVDSNALATGKGRTSYRITVDYKPKDQPVHRKEFTVPAEVYDAATKTESITVTYLPEQPAVSMVGDKVQADTEPMAIGAGVFLVAFVIWLYFRKKHREIGAALRGEA